MNTNTTDSPGFLTVLPISDIADRLVGKPYRDRGRGPTYYDCFGLFLELARGRGVELKDPFTPTSVVPQDYRVFYLNFNRIRPGAPLRPLDLLFSRRGDLQHVVTVLDDEWMLDTSRQIGARRRRLREVREQVQIFRVKCQQGLLASTVS